MTFGDAYPHLLTKPEYREIAARPFPAPGATAAPPSDLDARLAMDAELCPSGAGACGCGAEPRRCGHPDRPPGVFRRDCLACVTRAWWGAGAA